MQQKIAKKSQKNSSFVSLSFKYGVIFLLLALSIILAACGANASSDSITAAGATATPKASTTAINFNKVNQISPTPALPAQFCGVWLTNESPVYSSGGSIPIYAKFVTQQDGNPVGIGGATVSLSIQWGDLTGSQSTATTSADGLAVTYVSMSQHSGAINKLSLITATFVSGNVTCSVSTDRPASFALISGSTKTTKTSDIIPASSTPAANTNDTNASPPTTQSPGTHGGKNKP